MKLIVAVAIVLLKPYVVADTKTAYLRLPCDNLQNRPFFFSLYT